MSNYSCEFVGLYAISIIYGVRIVFQYIIIQFLSSPQTSLDQWALSHQILIYTKETIDGPLQTPYYRMTFVRTWKTVSSAGNRKDHLSKLCAFFAAENVPTLEGLECLASLTY